MLSFLPIKILMQVNELDFTKLYEIRLREGYPCKVKIGNEVLTLGNGLVVCSQDDISETLKNITERSLYAFNESLKKGFLTTKQGIRVGVAGECVYDNDKVLTIKNITSLNIRIPHQIIGSSDKIYKYVVNNRINSTLIISPPFYGKTTILKDLIRKINLEGKYNLLVVDERNEFCAIKGQNIDSIKYCNKDYAFSYGIRSMSPDVIITDELMGSSDWKSVEQAIYSGVKVIASCHCNNIKNLKRKECYIKGLFDRYVVLESDKGQAGNLKNIYDGDFNVL